MMIFLKYFNLTEMKKFISAALVVAMAAASCTSKEDLGNNNAPQQPAGDGTMTFSADFAEPIAKATPDYDESARSVTVLWQANDKVGVYATDGAPAEFTASIAGEKTALTGRTQPDAETYYAMYPYDENATLTEGEIATSLSAAQTATKDAFAAHLAVASTTGSSFSFQNVCGLVRVYVGCEHVTKIKFKGNSEEIVAGDIVVDAATAKFSLGTTQEKEITVIPPAGAETFEVGAYYFSVLPQEFKQGFTVTYETSDGFKELRQAGKVTIPRSSLVVGKAFTDIEGEGTVDDPFVIKTVHDLCNLSEALSTENPNYVKLANDIDMAEVETWTPINNDRTLENIKEIHFDGKNHTISNFKPTSVTAGTGGDQASFFGILYGSCENLNINANLNLPTMSSTAVLAGSVGYNGRGNLETKIENVHVSGSVTANKVVAGFAANFKNAKFKNCSADVDVNAADKHVGGFVARCDDAGCTAYFENCYATGNVSSTGDGSSKATSRFVGGFYGGNDKDANMTFTNCYATGNVEGDYQNGAFIAYLNGGTVTITDCYATGTVTHLDGGKNGKHIGGIVGVTKGKLNVTRCYFAGSLVSGKGEAVGGVLGLASANSEVTISDCFSIGDLTATSTDVGGMIGDNKDSKSLTIENCYASGTLTGANAGGMIGKNTKAATIKGCKHFTNVESLVGSIIGTLTEEGTNAKLTTEEAAAYATASAVATALKWDTKVWNLSGSTPTLKCFED